MENSLKMKTKCVFLSIIMIIVITNIDKVDVNATRSVDAEIVMERDSGRILYSNNAEEKMPMASTTKIVTCMTVLENCDISKVVEISSLSVGVEGSSIYLKEGETLTVEALLYGLMLRSGNDAAHALAIYVGKSVENFAKMMNEFAHSCGAENSNFTNPHGLHDENHYTTAKDLALITCKALSNETFKKIVSTKKITFGSRTFINKNKMLDKYEFADGVKTGYTKDAGRCLVSSATKNGMQLVAVVLNFSKTYEKSIELLDDCFSKYDLSEVVSENEIIGCVKLKNSILEALDYPIILEGGLKLPLSVNEKNGINYDFIPEENLCFPLRKGNCLGILRLYADKDLIFSAKLYTINTVNDYTFFDALKGVFARWSIYAN